MRRQGVSSELTEGERKLLQHRLKARTATGREVLRARIILVAARGEENEAIAED